MPAVGFHAWFYDAIVKRCILASVVALYSKKTCRFKVKLTYMSLSYAGMKRLASGSRESQSGKESG